MKRLDPAKFDASKPLAMQRFNTVAGHALAAGDPITIVPDDQEPKERGEVHEATARRLWASGTFAYASDVRPTPVESPQDAARRLLATEEVGGGYYLIRLPWLPEGSEKVRGKEALDARTTELIEAGQPEGFDPNAAASTAAANAGNTDLVTVEETEQERRGTEDRVQALVDGNSEKDLRDRIAEMDKLRAAAEPPLPAIGAKSDHNKTDLARLIVAAEDEAPATATGEPATEE